MCAHSYEPCGTEVARLRNLFPTGRLLRELRRRADIPRDRAPMTFSVGPSEWR
jgi:hypothetical protein